MTTLDVTEKPTESTHNQKLIGNKHKLNKASFPKFDIESDLLALSAKELDQRIKALDDEISLFERVHELDGPQDEKLVNHFERRQLNWNVGWENFQSRLNADCERRSELFKKESEVKTYIALAAVFEQCGDQDGSAEYIAKAEAAAFSYGDLVAKLDGADIVMDKPPEVFEKEAIQAKLAENFNQ